MAEIYESIRSLLDANRSVCKKIQAAVSNLMSKGYLCDGGAALSKKIVEISLLMNALDSSVCNAHNAAAKMVGKKSSVSCRPFLISLFQDKSTRISIDYSWVDTQLKVLISCRDTLITNSLLYTALKKSTDALKYEDVMSIESDTFFGGVMEKFSEQGGFKKNQDQASDYLNTAKKHNSNLCSALKKAIDQIAKVIASFKAADERMRRILSEIRAKNALRRSKAITKVDNQNIQEAKEAKQELEAAQAEYIATHGTRSEELDEEIARLKKYTVGVVTVHVDYSFPNSPSIPVKPRITNSADYRSAESYKKVMESFDVGNRYRYKPRNGDTWCNIYVWDVTTAMGCEIPHYYDPKTGAPLTHEYALKNKGKYLEMSAKRMRTWLSKHGSKYGWIECDAETAIAMANQGYPTVVTATTTNHVAMVAPQNPGESGVMISQAGANNFEHGKLANGFGKYSKNVKYYYHL